MKKDGRLKPFEVRVGARTHLRPEVRDFLLAGGCRPRVDSPWARWSKGESAPAPAGPVPALPECWGDGSDWQSFAETWGQWRPDEQLGDSAFWVEVAVLASRWMVNPPPPITALTAPGYCLAFDDAREAVSAGFRFDLQQWRRAAVLELLAEPAEGSAAAELRELLGRGEVPAELVGQVTEALAHQQEGQANG